MHQIYTGSIENRVADCQTSETPEVRAAITGVLIALATDANARVARAEKELMLAQADMKAAYLLLDGVTGGPANRRMNNALMDQLKRDV